MSRLLNINLKIHRISSKVELGLTFDINEEKGNDG